MDCPDVTDNIRFEKHDNSIRRKMGRFNVAMYGKNIFLVYAILVVKHLNKNSTYPELTDLFTKIQNDKNCQTVIEKYKFVFFFFSSLRNQYWTDQ